MQHLLHKGSPGVQLIIAIREAELQFKSLAVVTQKKPSIFRFDEDAELFKLTDKLEHSVKNIETTLEIMKERRRSIESYQSYSNLLIDMGMRTQSDILQFSEYLADYSEQ